MGLGSSSPGGTTGGQSNQGNNSSQDRGDRGDRGETLAQRKARLAREAAAAGPQIESLNSMGLKTLSKMFSGLSDFYNQPDLPSGNLNYGFTAEDVDLSITGGNDTRMLGDSSDGLGSNLDLTLAGNYQPNTGGGGDRVGDDGGGSQLLSDPKTVSKIRGGSKEPRRRLDDLLSDVSTRNRNRSILHPLGLPGNQPKAKTILGG